MGGFEDVPVSELVPYSGKESSRESMLYTKNYA